jgi:hypothetical protein
VENLSRYNEVFHVVCRKADPRVQALTPQGSVRFPSGVPLLSPPSCPAGQIAPYLAAGRSATIPMYLLLKGSGLRAVWEYSVDSAPFHRIVTGLVPVKLTPSKPPVATVHTSSSVSLTVPPTPGHHGALLYADATECPGPGGSGPQYFESTFGWFEWQHAAGDKITPRCPDPLRWRVVAAWVGQPSVAVDYTKPGSR